MARVLGKDMVDNYVFVTKAEMARIDAKLAKYEAERGKSVRRLLYDAGHEKTRAVTRERARIAHALKTYEHMTHQRIGNILGVSGMRVGQLLKHHYQPDEG